MKTLDNTHKYGKAYEGDTYIENCSHAAKTKASWAKALLVGAALAALVDFYNIHDLFAQTSDAAEGDVLTWLVTAGIVAVYVFAGFAVGNPLRSYFAFREKSDLVIPGLVGVSELAIVGAVSYFRYGTEAAIAASRAQVLASSASSATSSQLSGLGSSGIVADPVAVTALYTFIMIAGALMSIVYSYKSRDAVAERVCIEAEASLAHDAQIYNEAFRAVMCDADQESKLEEQERELDALMTKAVARINMLAADAAMVLDPADAFEVARSSQLIAESYYQSCDETRASQDDQRRTLPVSVLLRGQAPVDEALSA